ncbi:hypothetical protein HN937_17240 [Candidatus Poribacteria bacterium]|nr:hypothetical protein [Candidatus Poribacteria bacterium]
MMLGVVGFCAATDRMGWGAGRRVAFVLLCWLAHALLSLAAVFALGLPLKALGLLRNVPEHMQLFEMAHTFAGALPVLAFAMTRSRLFMRQSAGDASSGTHGEAADC